MMNQKFPSLFSYKSEKCYLYYQFSKKILAFFCFPIRSDLETILNKIKEKLPEFKISFLVNLKLSESFVFLSIKVIEEEILSQLGKKIQNAITEISPQSPMKMLSHNLLSKMFFFS